MKSRVSKPKLQIILSDLNAGLAPRMYGPSFIALNLGYP